MSSSVQDDARASNLSLSPLPGSSSSIKKRSHEVLLTNVSLSIEPCENLMPGNRNRHNNSNSKDVGGNITRKEGSSGPAYFSPPKSSTPARTRTDGRTKDEPNEAGVEDDYDGVHNNSDTGGNSEHDHVVDKRGDSHGALSCSNTDPSLCRVELTLHTAKLPEIGMTTPVKKSNRRNLSEIDDRVAAKDEAILIANIDGNHFQVDLNRILNIIVGPSDVQENKHCASLGNDTTSEARASNNNSTNNNATTTRETPAFLLLEFPSCFFRFFLQLPSTNSTSDDETVIGTLDSLQETKDDNRTKFDAVRNKLVNVLTEDCLLPFPLSYCGLTARSAQKLDSSEVVSVQRAEFNNNSDPIGCARRCLWSYSQSWKDLVSFDYALENPILVQSSIGSTEKNKFKDTIHRLMTEIPKQVASSFIEEDKWTMALASHNDKLCAEMQAFENVIDDFWMDNNTSENGKNNKRRRDEEDHNNPGQQLEGMTKNGCMERYAELMKEHKRHMISKHELYLLPLRG